MLNLSLPGFSLFTPSTPKLPDPLPPLPTPEDPAVKAKADEVALAQQRASGLPSTIKTSGLGDTSKATVTRKTLGA